MTIAALIVAAGRGTRAGGDCPKQWREIAGRPMLAHTIAALRAARRVGPVALVLHPDDMARAAGPDFEGCVIAQGGADRAASVRNGLAALAASAPDKVLIHDAARPCAGLRVIDAVIDALEHAPGAAPALAVTDALWTGADGRVTGTGDRSGLYRAQTPQGFDFEAIRAAHAAHPGGAADDVEVARLAGIEVAIVPGDEDNLKVTLPGDFARAEQVLRGRHMAGPDIRLGNGFDVHRFGPGDRVTLCGVDVAHDRGLQGHSDADVGMHAITDAIYGALAQGDIGQHFPPSDPQWKGAASDIFLRHAVDLAARMGYRIGNVDCTLICEYPKIGPHAQAMRDALAGIMGLDRARISVKATTSERLGFTGRGEGIAAQATALLVPA
ncbi:bifunctional 2-C-methyl-D-erythritol 4-phosphate cytidylyltransferase/2-C-methyl-D-erythritol 2,4-cyclodiphosphate synthase [Pukyongiella litopenaei]|uniref:Bifunctional enzyme IspD/IspF n=1 Tax=Pukyongiella litopenaei TaxID=2605946 RepID=A0A2S0MUR9_9RHOB|nr:bifunctional 2-C-methyl-D-erythritol 4-phosphate cytidylyltransferase/2-C-methyl-D-erythritol 2,4-cyclodiphosphate synthase [Pukyongiella litopenaei]AVO39443.1 bifunctional 2-C-methyl-D-erythritol 4-phosphate cytidylyltransferase/2-C-methyl-D-erythritol 2,4-cyclodiphosphate synthase [Pukyongiella litopenaei]